MARQEERRECSPPQGCVARVWRPLQRASRQARRMREQPSPFEPQAPGMKRGRALHVATHNGSSAPSRLARRNDQVSGSHRRFTAFAPAETGTKLVPVGEPGISLCFAFERCDSDVGIHAEYAPMVGSRRCFISCATWWVSLPDTPVVTDTSRAARSDGGVAAVLCFRRRWL